MKILKVVNWDKWQTYRKDRGTPPWIKVHRNLMSNSEWASLSDAEKGQLVSIWVIAADKCGTVPSDLNILKKICLLDEEPNVQKFIELGFLEPPGCQVDAKLTPNCQLVDAPETETETEAEAEADSGSSSEELSPEAIMSIPLNKKGNFFYVTRGDLDQWQETFPAVGVELEIRRCRQWSIDNPQNRKTPRGIRKHISGWLGRAQDKALKNSQNNSLSGFNNDCEPVGLSGGVK